ncbi:YhcH/YjgK/YiaL family protein [Salmonella enterica]|nr:DUF386 family protein [Salmonella enterica subsp. enterica serovar Oranienburg]
MIYGDIAHITDIQLKSLHPAISKALNYLKNNDLHALPLNEKIIIDDGIFFSIVEPTTKPLSECKPETHRRNLDIHYTLSGNDRLGIAFNGTEYLTNADYLVERDVTFLPAACMVNENFINVKPGQFMVVFPEDLHRALCMQESPEKIKKLVVKIDISLL